MNPVTAWTEVSLVVDGELAEAVADALSRYLPGGVVIESTDVHPDHTMPQTVGPVRVCGYIPVDDQHEAVQTKIEQALYYLGRIEPLPPAQYQPIQETNWMENWKKNYHPIEVGERLLITPAWLEVDAGDRVPILINPGMAFGTGTHPTTQLCLSVLETYLPEGAPVLDIGCGSAILSIAAVKLGASHAYGVDIDAKAVESALENVALNQVNDTVTLGVGSVEDVLAGEYAIQHAPLVLANMITPILLMLLEAGLGRLIAPGGKLVLSGILAEDQEAQIRAALVELGLDVIGRSQQGEWIALVVIPQ